MVIEFKDKHTERICNDIDYAKKYYTPDVVARLSNLMYKLHISPRIDVFFKPPCSSIYQTKRKKGKMEGQIGMRLGKKERVTLILVAENINGEDHIKILEVSYHYGD